MVGNSGLDLTHGPSMIGRIACTTTETDVMPPAPTSRREFIRLLGLGATATWAGSMPFLPASAATPLRVIVLGAGLAGLRAALLLEGAGCEVTVIEGRARLGGRLFTRADLPGRPEQGGSTIGHSYTRLIGMAERLGVELAPPTMGHGPKTGSCKACHAQGKVPDRRGGPGSLIVWRGRQVLQGDWIDALPDLSDAERKVSPDRLMATYLLGANPLADAEAWTRREHSALDAMSLKAYLQGLGATPAALELMDVAPNCPGLDKASALWALRDMQRRSAAAGGTPMEFPEGASAFVERLAGGLRHRPLTAQVVTAVASTDRKAVVSCAGGGVHEADYVISTLPLPALAKVKFDPPPPATQLAAFSEISHTPITRVYFRVKSPFWQQDGLPNTMWTDSPLERIFAARDEAGEVIALTCHADGPGAQVLDAMDERARLRFAEETFVKMRPAAKGAIEAVATMSWAAEPLTGGAYPFYAPGQIGRLRPSTALPLGRIHFAGEHTAVTSPGMEGACESADRAVAEVLART